MKVIGSVALALAVVCVVLAYRLTSYWFVSEDVMPFVVFAVVGLVMIMVSAVITNDFGDDVIVHGVIGFILAAVGAVVAVVSSWLAPKYASYVYYHGVIHPVVDGPTYIIWMAYAFGLAVYVISSLVQCVADDW